jgi:hypothetical protein
MDVISIPLIVAEVVGLAMIIGGILLFPTARRLGGYLEVLIEEKRLTLTEDKRVKELGAGPQVERLERELAETREELGRVAERQASMESALKNPTKRACCRGSARPRPAVKLAYPVAFPIFGPCTL